MFCVAMAEMVLNTPLKPSILGKFYFFSSFFVNKHKQNGFNITLLCQWFFSESGLCFLVSVLETRKLLVENKKIMGWRLGAELTGFLEDMSKYYNAILSYPKKLEALKTVFCSLKQWCLKILNLIFISVRQFGKGLRTRDSWN